MLSILNLDDDSLVNIFQFLSIYELIDAEKVCSIFKDICEVVYGSKRFHKMRIELRDLRIEYFKDILNRVGKSLKAFEFSGGFLMDEKVKHEMIEGITKHCPKLLKLKINYIRLAHPENNAFDQLQQCFSKLTFLDLSHCAINESVLVRTLDGDKLRNIKVLKVLNIKPLFLNYCF